MPLEKPPLVTVSPGEPVTAQAWNALVNGLSALYDAVIALGGETVQITVASGGTAVRNATVIATPTDGGTPVAALPPFGTAEAYTLAGLTPGTWRLHVAAPGFVPRTTDVQVPVAEPVAVQLELDGARMPDLFGRAASEAVTVLRDLGIQIERILDTTGNDMPVAGAAADLGSEPVLLQLPEPGIVVRRDERARLVIAAALEVEPVVEMPDLKGLTLAEATKVLEDLGLVLGSTRSLG